MQTPNLLIRCANGMAEDHLSHADTRKLRRWYLDVGENTATLARAFTVAPLPEWEQLILEHRAHTHEWYDFIATAITIEEMAVFLLENAHYPVFLTLLRAIEQIQICEQGRAAVAENIADEHQPVPHADLMRRLMQSVGRRAGDDIRLSSYPSLIDRTLVFYYGYYCDPWHLVGSVFATERMGTRRVICMDRGLSRLGLSRHEREFTIIHAQCDDHHASDWLERVIIPSAELEHGIKPAIAAGIAACLETSADYLDFLLRRAMTDRR